MGSENRGGPVITAWSAVSPFGIGAEPFAQGLRGGRPPAASGTVVSGELAYSVPEFEARTVLGKKGTRAMDRVTALTVATVGRLIGREGNAGTALVLGTTTGSAQSMMDFTRSSLTEDRPHLVDPARFPNTVMNCAAGQSAIWYGLDGPNATIAGGRVAALLALQYAWRLQRSGRARTVICGGAEENSDARSWLHHHGAGPAGAAAAVGEGSAMLLLEPGGAVDGGGLAEILAVESAAVAGGRDVRTALRSCLARAFGRGPFDPAELWAVAPGGAGGAEGEAIADLLEGRAVPELDCAALIGDAGAASAAFQIAAVLSEAARDRASVGRLALVTGTDRDGTVACALLRLLPGAAASSPEARA